jgi:hypothetical protein
MRFGWLLPDASYEALSESWTRTAYRPRHGKPPLAVRSACTAAMAISRARERYLGAVDDVDVSVRAADPAGARRIDIPKSS